MTTVLIVLAIAVVLAFAFGGPTLVRGGPRRRVTETVYEDEPDLVEADLVDGETVSERPRRRARRMY